MKKPTTIEELLKIVQPTKDQNILLSYKGNDPIILGAQVFMLAEIIAKYFNRSETENYWWGWYKKGSSFDDSYCSDWHTWSSVSSRLKFHIEEDFLYATQTFPEIYKTLMES